MKAQREKQISIGLTAASTILMLVLYRARSSYPMIPFAWLTRAEESLFAIFVAINALLIWWLLSRKFNKGKQVNLVVIVAAVLLGGWICSRLAYGLVVMANAISVAAQERVCLTVVHINASPDGFISREKSARVMSAIRGESSTVYFRRNSVDLSKIPVGVPVCLAVKKGLFGYRLVPANSYK